jgi:hypothetical protein
MSNMATTDGNQRRFFDTGQELFGLNNLLSMDASNTPATKRAIERAEQNEADAVIRSTVIDFWDGTFLVARGVVSGFTRAAGLESSIHACGLKAYLSDRPR